MDASRRPVTRAKARERGGHADTPPAIAELIVDLAAITPTDAILEAACGQGAVLDALDTAGAIDVTAYEVDRRVFFAASERHRGFTIERRDFLRTPRSQRFDLAVGNPPYVSWSAIPETTRRILQKRPFWRDLTNGDWDLLYAFMVWQVEQLREGGRMVIVTPSTWLSAAGAASLRRYLIANGTFESIVSFGPRALFGEGSSASIIIAYRKGTSDATARRRRIRVVELTDRHSELEKVIPLMRSDLERIVTERSHERVKPTHRAYNRPQFADDGVWYLATPSEVAALRALEDSAPARVADIADIAVGPVSGANEAFALTEEEASLLPASEHSLLRRFVRAEHCQRYALTGTSPYLFADDVPDVETFERDFPVAFARLSSHRATLEARYLLNGRRWWDWATVRGLSATDDGRGRIFVPGIDRSTSARYSFSPSSLVGLGDVLTITPSSAMREDPRYLLAWLNSALVEHWYRIKGSRAGARLRYSQGQVSAIPYRSIDRRRRTEVKIHDDIVRLTQGLIDRSVADPVEVERQINQLIGRLLSTLPAAR